VLGIKRIKIGTITDEHLIVVTPVTSGPAAKAGVLPGDDIVAVDGKSVLPFDPYQKVNALIKVELNRKSASSDFKARVDAEKKRIDGGITIDDAQKTPHYERRQGRRALDSPRGGREDDQVKITPKQFTVDPVAQSVLDSGKVAYIKVNCLSQETADRFAEGLARAESEGAKGL